MPVAESASKSAGVQVTRTKENIIDEFILA